MRLALSYPVHLLVPWHRTDGWFAQLIVSDAGSEDARSTELYRCALFIRKAQKGKRADGIDSTFNSHIRCTRVQ